MKVRDIIDFAVQDIFETKCQRNYSINSFDDVELVRNFPKSFALPNVKFQFEIGEDKISEDLTKSIERALQHQAKGAKTIFASINGEIAGVYCICDIKHYTPYKFMSVFSNRERYGMIFHCVTSKKYRNMGFYKEALNLICESYSKYFDTILVTASHFNRISKLGIVHSGFNLNAILFHMEIGRKSYTALKRISNNF